MNALAIVAVAIAALAVAAAVVSFAATARRESRREAVEQAIARAGHEYLAKHGISCRAIGVVLADGSATLLIEAAPHKKLRFSFVIEPSIKSYVKKMAGIEPHFIFWRFPIDEAQGKPARRGERGAQAEASSTEATQPDASPAATRALTSTGSDGLDDYLHPHRSYHIEEVSWNDFNNTISDAANSPAADVSTAASATDKPTA